MSATTIPGESSEDIGILSATRRRTIREFALTDPYVSAAIQLVDHNGYSWPVAMDNLVVALVQDRARLVEEAEHDRLRHFVESIAELRNHAKIKVAVRSLANNAAAILGLGEGGKPAATPSDAPPSTTEISAKGAGQTLPGGGTDAHAPAQPEVARDDDGHCLSCAETECRCAP